MTTTTLHLGRVWTKVADPEDGPVTLGLNPGSGTTAVYYGETAPSENNTDFIELAWAPPRPDFAFAAPNKSIWCRAAGDYDVTEITVVKG